VDLRGHGDSSLGWPSITRTDVAGDLIAVIRYLGGPAVIVGHSISGGAATVAAAKAPELVPGIVELSPLTRTQPLKVGALFRNRRYRRCGTLVLGSPALIIMGTADPDFADPKAEVAGLIIPFLKENARA
jgi:pimeloyl-ACP methyl ester carboxylesterase